ncbi:MAG: spore coat associated protein CotJA [Clostridia bacterium]|nr:spore coat associated protein CotJA [Clostridia bacterium]
MNQQNYKNAGACCFSQRAPVVDPQSVDKVVAAGEVCSDSTCPLITESGGCRLAMIYFPSQAYKAGYCPNEAMQMGTLFPELVSPYERRCCNGNER